MNALQIIDEIELLVENGQGGWLGKRLISEKEFLDKIQNLNAVLSSNQAISIVEELKQLVETSKGGWLGKRLINEEEFFTLVQRLRSSLSRSQANFATPSASVPAPSPRREPLPIVFRDIDEFEVLLEKSQGGWLGKRLVNEKEFLAAIQHLRSMLSSSRSLHIADEIELIVKNGKYHWLGKSLVNEEELFIKIQQLRSALTSE